MLPQIVTAYYLISAKQPHSFYMDNIKRFFKFVTQPVLFFTSYAMSKKLIPLAGKNITFRIIEFNKLGVFNDFPREFWERQIQRDPESYHSWELGAIWANKKYFIREASNEYPDKEWFVWMDAGSVRKESWGPFIEPFTKRNFTSEPGVYMQVLDRLPKDKTYFRYPDQHVAGALILFHRSCIQNYINDYNTVLKEYDANNIAGTSDQYIMATLLNKYPQWTGVERGLVKQFNYVNTCPDPWFFFLSLL